MDEGRIDALELVDETVLDQMAADLDVDTVSACLDTFLAEMLGRVERIVNAMQVHDWVEARAEAHALKSIAGTFGAERLAAVALGIEEAGDAHSTAAAAGRADALRQLARQTADVLAARSRRHHPRDGL